MEKYLLLAGILIASALVVPGMFEDHMQGEPVAGTNRVVAVSTERQPPAVKRNPLAGRKEVIATDDKGHFIAAARMNGVRLQVLVDTGATMVALNESTARKLGIRLSNSDFKYKLNTANGVAEAALAKIDRIEIGRVKVNNVKATISRDSALNVVLLGMTFLNKLDKFEIARGKLVLSQ